MLKLESCTDILLNLIYESRWGRGRDCSTCLIALKDIHCQKILGYTPELDKVGKEVVLAFQKGFHLKLGAMKREQIKTNLTQNEEIECVIYR